jgi:phenylalanyl-tRNA synthetase beta chain
VAIGAHDLDTLSPPFVYSADPPSEIKFVPLNQTKEFRADDLMVFYQNDNHLKHYLHIIKDEPLYPIIRDSKGVVLSMPPIINGDHSKITTKTKNIFFECTATDLNKANIVLDMLVTMFSEYAKEKFTAEGTHVVYESEAGVKPPLIYPSLEYREETIDVQEVNDIVGIQITAEDMSKGLNRMTLSSCVDSKSQDKKIIVKIPPTRHDVIHACDIVEDVAISYGYENIVMTVPQTSTLATQFPLNKLTDQLRENVAQAGFTEGLTFSLCSIEDECEKIRHPRATKEPTLVRVANPKTLEFQAARNSLISGLLKTIQANKKMPLPLKLFEISDVVLLDETADTGSKNDRRFCAVYYNKTPGFEVVHGLLDRVMQILGATFDPKNGYFLRAADDPTFFDGRGAEIVYKNKVIGKFGVLHPEVLENFELTNPASAVEITIEDFL